MIATQPNSEGLFAVTSFTSLKGAKDQTVILWKAEHPFLKWDTCISYAQAEIMSVEKLENDIQCGRARMHQDVTRQFFNWFSMDLRLLTPRRTEFATLSAPLARARTRASTFA
jgi:hypothetical protein